MGDAVTTQGTEHGSDDGYRTRPGTPMIGPYSVNQMDDFHVAIAVGQVKATGIMNLLQRVYIAERCGAGARVVDVCCGRGLQLPTLYQYAPHIREYVGLDIAAANLAECQARIVELDSAHGHRPFPIELVECDVAQPWPTSATGFDVAVYTSAFEHLPRELGVASLVNVASALRPNGLLYLSTPNTAGPPPRRLQHRVHVYEWSTDELEPTLTACGLDVIDQVGLFSPEPSTILEALTENYGPDAADWYRHLQRTVPAALLNTIAAAALPAVATEVLYICRRSA